MPGCYAESLLIPFYLVVPPSPLRSPYHVGFDICKKSSFSGARSETDSVNLWISIHGQHAGRLS